jgi:hypothetical protein
MGRDFTCLAGDFFLGEIGAGTAQLRRFSVVDGVSSEEQFV